MILYVMRHGIAEDIGPDRSDASRRLTDEGTTRVRRIACGLRTLACQPAAIVSSPLARARQTADLVAAELHPAAGVSILTELSPGGAPAVVARELGPWRANDMMIVGHQPDLSRLLAWCLTGDAEYPAIELRKGAVAALDFGLSFVSAGGAVLLWLIPPAALRRVET